jgi:hypothetical protein
MATQQNNSATNTIMTSTTNPSTINPSTSNPSTINSSTSNPSTSTSSTTKPSTTTSSKTSPSKKLSTSSSSSKVITISGLDIMTSRVIIQSTSAIIGVIVFVFVPILANSINKPIASVILNVIPNDLILAYFIVEDNIEEYLLGCIFSPLLNVIDNIISYVLYVYIKTTASVALWANILIWVFAIILSYIFI